MHRGLRMRMTVGSTVVSWRVNSGLKPFAEAGFDTRTDFPLRSANDDAGASRHAPNLPKLRLVSAR